METTLQDRNDVAWFGDKFIKNYVSMRMSPDTNTAENHNAGLRGR
jgi:hypothetical protein